MQSDCPLEAWGSEGSTGEEGGTGLHSPPSRGQLQAILLLVGSGSRSVTALTSA